METTTDSAKSETKSDDGGTTGSSGGTGSESSGGTGSESSGGATSDGTRKNYSRGENQKPVTDTYRENWNHIFKRGKPRRR